jgi:hypothetical protein
MELEDEVPAGLAVPAFSSRDMKADQEVGFASAVIAEGKTLAGSPTAIDLPPRAVPVSHGRTILIRPVRAQDEADLSNLYDGLDVNDRYLRFFSAYRPSPEFIRKLANPAPGEARAVAELNEAGETRLVAEAGYSLLTNGNGEFAMVVARDWRGWLGPYLLDVVIELAAANRVPNLEAEVLTMNRSMLALLRARGCVLLSHDGWTECRLMVGTGRQGPTWPDTDERPHVLVETPDGRWPLEDAAEAAGMRVITCTGPSENHPCPVLSGHECALVAGADAIVVRNTSHKAIWETLARSHTSSHSDIPVVIDPVGDHTQAIPLDDVRVPAFFHFSLQTARSGAACSRA